MKHTLRKLGEMFFTETLLLAASPVCMIVESRIKIASYPGYYTSMRLESAKRD